MIEGDVKLTDHGIATARGFLVTPQADKLNETARTILALTMFAFIVGAFWLDWKAALGATLLIAVNNLDKQCFLTPEVKAFWRKRANGSLTDFFEKRKGRNSGPQRQS